MKRLPLLLMFCFICNSLHAKCDVFAFFHLENNRTAIDLEKKDTVERSNSEKIAIIALSLEDPSIIYDGKYRKIAYPNGDVDPKTGVCTDVLIRTLRLAIGYDLQKEVYLWRSSTGQITDKNIDHRLCKKLVPFFEYLAEKGIVEKEFWEFRPGSFVFFKDNKGEWSHVMIYVGDGLVMHNNGYGQIVEDFPQDMDPEEADTIAFRFK